MLCRNIPTDNWSCVSVCLWHLSATNKNTVFFTLFFPTIPL